MASYPILLTLLLLPILFFGPLLVESFSLVWHSSFRSSLSYDPFHHTLNHLLDPSMILIAGLITYPFFRMVPLINSALFPHIMLLVKPFLLNSYSLPFFNIPYVIDYPLPTSLKTLHVLFVPTIFAIPYLISGIL
jgi:hypothetical protein